MYVLEQTKPNQVSKHARTAIGHKGQGHTGHRHQAHRHANVFKGLKGKPGDHPDTDQPAKGIISPPRNHERSEKEESKAEQDETRS